VSRSLTKFEVGVKVLKQVFEKKFEIHQNNSRGRHFREIFRYYAENMDTRKSCRVLCTLFGTTIICKENKQYVMTLSTVHVEYIAFVEG